MGYVIIGILAFILGILIAGLAMHLAGTRRDKEDR